MSPEKAAEGLDVVDATRAQMLMIGRDLEKRFPGCNITLFVSAPGSAKLPEPQYNHVTSAEPDDLAAVLRAHLAEMGK